MNAPTLSTLAHSLILLGKQYLQCKDSGNIYTPLVGGAWLKEFIDNEGSEASEEVAEVPSGAYDLMDNMFNCISSINI